MQALTHCPKAHLLLEVSQRLRWSPCHSQQLTHLAERCEAAEQARIDHQLPELRHLQRVADGWAATFEVDGWPLAAQAGWAKCIGVRQVR